MTSKYARLGVDIEKKGIESFRSIVNNVYPQAFCVISQSEVFPHQGLTLHTDSAGSKPIQSYLNWKETNDLISFQGLAQDVLAMNIDDIICVGATPISFVDYIALNPFTIPKTELLTTLSHGFKECLHQLKDHRVDLLFSGGETADLPDMIRTLDVSGTIFGLVEFNNVISGANITEGDQIIGLRSGGKTKFEKTLNSGIMCNGITLARHALIKKEYAEKYPEIQDPMTEQYYGIYAPLQYLDELEMTVGEAITSPTRIFTPIITEILEKYGAHVTGLVHNTGGGQTKCLRIGTNIHYIKQCIKVDPIFRLIQRGSKEDWRTMLQNYNMGTGFEIFVENEVAEDVLSVPQKYGVEAQIIGRCEKKEGANSLTINSPWGKFQYF